MPCFTISPSLESESQRSEVRGLSFMIDFWRSAIRQQFHAAIDMLANAIEACPDSVWSGQEPRPFWYLAFHVLFFLDLYLSAECESRFHPPPPFGLTELAPEVRRAGARLQQRRTARLP